MSSRACDDLPTMQPNGVLSAETPSPRTGSAHGAGWPPAPSEEVEITVTLEQSDYVYGYLWAHFLGVERRPMLAGLGLLLLFVFLVLNWLYRVSPVEVGLPQLIGPVLALAAAVCMPIYTYWRARRAFRRHRWLQQPTRYTISDRGIASRAASYSGFREWRRIWRVEENGWSFLVYLSQSQVVVLPKRFFDSEDRILAFRELSAAHCGRVSLSGL